MDRSLPAATLKTAPTVSPVAPSRPPLHAPCRSADPIYVCVPLPSPTSTALPPCPAEPAASHSASSATTTCLSSIRAKPAQTNPPHLERCCRTPSAGTSSTQSEYVRASISSHRPDPSQARRPGAVHRRD